MCLRFLPRANVLDHQDSDFKGSFWGQIQSRSPVEPLSSWLSATLLCQGFAFEEVEFLETGIQHYS